MADATQQQNFLSCGIISSAISPGILARLVWAGLSDAASRTRRCDSPGNPRSCPSGLDGKKGLEEEEDRLGESLESCQDNLERKLNFGNHHSETTLCETGNAHLCRDFRLSVTQLVSCSEPHKSKVEGLEGLCSLLETVSISEGCCDKGPQTRRLQFSSVQLFSRVRLFATSWTTAIQASLSITNSRSLLKLISIESVMDAIQPSHPLSAPSPPAFNLSQH
ncbi:hypothetical protein MG293_000067 [Ovis ammon polii]|uniref:Uncharacterized protein n=1 Tax=Ovis ammon polii TaxID=230172 RepID=A0AAD4YHQ4_OVIAM|nr:hypothetical protein MG293_000067 [Ovis ammon polii]